MPQLIPFYFVNEVVCLFSLLTILIYIQSKYLLPNLLGIYTTRLSFLT